MIIDLAGVSKGRALPEVSLRFGTGRATLVEAETEQRPTVLGLLASGRMRAARGTVTIDGEVDYRTLRTRVALIDAPDVSEPAPNVSLSGVVSEELMFAGLPAGPRAVAARLEQLDATEFAASPLGTVDPAVRIRVLAELALLRPGVEGLVVVSPDRHGGHPGQWWSTLEEIAARGIAVLVIVGHAAVVALDASAPALRPTRRRRPRTSSPLARSRKAAS